MWLVASKSPDNNNTNHGKVIAGLTRGCGSVAGSGYDVTNIIKMGNFFCSQFSWRLASANPILNLTRGLRPNGEEINGFRD